MSLPRGKIEQDRGVEVNEAQIKKREFTKLARVPAILKSTFIKIWFAGSLYYFIGWGIFSNTVDNFDTIAALGLGIGLFTDLLIYRLFGMIDNKYHDLERYMFWKPHKVLSLIINVAYCAVISLATGYLYHLINLIGNHIKGTTGEIVLGAEPILYGVFFVVIDLFVLTIRNLIFYQKYFGKQRVETVEAEIQPHEYLDNSASRVEDSSVEKMP